MLGIRLDASVERLLEQHAREVGRPKSVLVRDWIIERLNSEAVDERLRNAARIAAETDGEDSWTEPDLDD